jgi:putrescine transport system ATP-binding protein
MATASAAQKKALTGAQPREALVRIDRVTKKFDEAVAVDDVSLTIHKGEIFALLGGSGCGKSTLLRMLAGFERPTEGRIILDGEDITDLPPYERPINMMFQSYALFPHMSVADNIAFGLKQDRMSKAEIDARVEEMLKLVHMTQYAKRKPHQLSGVSVSAWPWPARWPSGPSCCCSTNPWGRWTRSCARRCSWNWSRSSNGSA